MAGKRYRAAGPNPGSLVELRARAKIRTSSAISSSFDIVDDLYRPRNHCVFNLIGALVLLAFFLSHGCEYTSEIRTKPDKGDDATTSTDGVDKTGASYDSGAIVGNETETAGSFCPSDNLTRPCSCQFKDIRVAGRQTCDRSVGWSDCDCLVPAVGNNDHKGNVDEPTVNKEVAVFSWEKTLPVSSGSCKAGHYAGVFSGFYNSPATSASDVSFSPVGIPIIGTVEFDLNRIGNGEYFEIKDGVMEGFALLVCPFRGDLVGTVNCEGDPSLMEIGLKNGVYRVVDTNYYFDGKAVSLYNKKNASFSSGEWAATEPLDYDVVIRNEDGTADLGNAVFAPLPQLVPGTVAIIDTLVEGGTGEWDAFWVGPATGVGTSTTKPTQNDNKSRAENYITY